MAFFYVVRRALIDLFKILDTKPEDREPYGDSALLEFPYVNGGLFADENIEIPQFTDDIKEVKVAKTFVRINRTRKSKINVFYCSICGRKMYKAKGALLKCRINSVVSDDIKCVSATMNVAQAEKAVFVDIKMKYIRKQIL